MPASSPSSPHSDKMQIRDYFVVLLRESWPPVAAAPAAAAVATPLAPSPLFSPLAQSAQRIRMQFVLPQLILFMSLGYKYICEIAYLCRCLPLLPRCSFSAAWVPHEPCGKGGEQGVGAGESRARTMPSLRLHCLAQILKCLTYKFNGAIMVRTSHIRSELPLPTTSLPRLATLPAGHAPKLAHMEHVCNTSKT